MCIKTSPEGLKLLAQAVEASKKLQGLGKDHQQKQSPGGAIQVVYLQK